MSSALYLDSVTQAEALLDVATERDYQDEKWGPAPDNFLDRPDGTGEQYTGRANLARANADVSDRLGTLTWKDILNEEVWEAYAESDPDKLYVELIQVAAVAVAWAETIKARS